MAGRSRNPSRFLTPEERTSIVRAIEEAERRTSGEIRVHLESRCGGNPLLRATRIFDELGMSRTAERNGTLLYLALQDRMFAVIGDAGIDQKVPVGFWDDVRASMEEHFRQGRFAEGLAAAIGAIGARLAEFFPRRTEDRNELTNEISEGSSEEDARTDEKLRKGGEGESAP